MSVEDLLYKGGLLDFSLFFLFLKENWESQSSMSNKKINPNIVHILQRHLFSGRLNKVKKVLS